MARVRGLPVVAVVIAVVTACGGDDSGAPGVGTGGPSTTTPPVTLAAPAPANPTSVPVADRVEVRFDLPGGPDPFAVTEDAVWVKRDDGFVLRIDPATDEVEAEIEVTDELCQGIGAGDGEVWTCDDRDLARIDPEADEVVATVAVDKIAEQQDIPVAFGAAWVLTGDGSTLVGVRDDVVAVEIDLGLRCSDLAADEEHGLWASCLTEDAAVFIDLDAEAVSHRVDGVTGTRTVAVSGAYAWIGYDGGVAQVDALTGEVLGVADAPTGLGGDLFATPDGVWVRAAGTLHWVDAETLDVVEEVVIPEESGGSVVEAFGSVWVSASDDAVVYRLSCGPAACT